MNRYQLAKRVAVLGIGANILLLAMKLTIGFISRSQAMIADGFNSAGDVFASVITYIGNKISSQPSDQNHPYGHGKAEYIFSMVISFSLFLVAYTIFRSSLDSVLHREVFTFSWWLIIVAVATIISKAILFFYCQKAGRAHNNLLILANAEDHRNDVFITLSTLVGIIFGQFGVHWIDGIVGMGIAFWIAYTGIQIFMSSYDVLMDTTIDETVKKDIMDVIEDVNGVSHVDEVTAKPVGLHFIILVKVSVPREMTVYEGHGIAAQIKEKLRDFQHVEDVVVHVNPDPD